jgi:adenylate kinase
LSRDRERDRKRERERERERINRHLRRNSLGQLAYVIIKAQSITIGHQQTGNLEMPIVWLSMKRPQRT